MSAGFPLPEIEMVEGEPLVGESFLDLAVPKGSASSPVKKMPEAV